MDYGQAVKRMRWGVVFVCAAAAAVAADDNPAKALHRVAIKQLVRAAKLPNYTCVETVTRDYYHPKPARAAANAGTSAGACSLLPGASPANLQWTATDRLRLDVALTERREIYSWVGASKFEDADVTAVVRHGPVATGSFGALLAVVFGQDAATFHFEKSVTVGGRKLMEFTFQMGAEDSRYTVKTRDSWVKAAYSGTVQIDPAADEVAAIALQTAELPSATDLCRTSTAMELGAVRIGAAEFLLPREARQRFVTLNGNQMENTTTFAACREYLGESTIDFSEPSETGGAGRQDTASTRAGLPADLPFAFELTTPIAADTAAAGDSIAGRLVGALRGPNGKVLAPARAVVEGRLLRVEIHHTAPVGATVVFNLGTVEIGGVKTPLLARRDFSPVRRNVRTAIALPFAWERNAALFQLTGAHPVMKSGERSKWRTVTAAAGDAGAVN